LEQASSNLKELVIEAPPKNTTTPYSPIYKSTKNPIQRSRIQKCLATIDGKLSAYLILGSKSMLIILGDGTAFNRFNSMFDLD
jgi:hypothetical protein